MHCRISEALAWLQARSKIVAIPVWNIPYRVATVLLAKSSFPAKRLRTALALLILEVATAASDFPAGFGGMLVPKEHIADQYCKKSEDYKPNFHGYSRTLQIISAKTTRLNPTIATAVSESSCCEVAIFFAT